MAARSFLINLAALTAVLAGIFLMVKALPFFQGFVVFVWISLAFLAISTLVTYFIMVRAMSMKEHSNFLIAFGTGFALKALAALIFLCYFIFIDTIKDTNFILPFFFMYFAFTALLVWQVWQQSKGKALP